MVLLILLACIVTFSSCDNNVGSNNGDADDSSSNIVSTVPVYKGMTISSIGTDTLLTQTKYSSCSSVMLLSSNKENGNTNPANNNGSHGNSEHHYGHDKELEEDIEDIVSIDVIIDDEVKYHVEQNSTFIIEVHISNPKQYEIQSFTLNGKKYANYMFKEGSTMELLLLEVQAPSNPGYVDYTIDAIKYIDGTEIKDVDMSSGDKSIKAGVTYPTAPSASITEETVTTTNISLSINVTDPYAVIGDNELSIYLSDGENVVASKKLTVGDNTVNFNNLIMSKTYEYGVVTAFDLIDGKDTHKEWLLTKEVTTLGAYSITNIATTKDSISFDAVRTGEVGKIDSVSIYDATTDTLVKLAEADVRAFTGLLAGHTYDIYVDFSYTISGEEVKDWVAAKGITTVAKVAPTVEIKNMTSTQTGIGFEIATTDADSILFIDKIELYKGDTLVKTAEAVTVREFTELLSNNEYTVKVTYSYDLNDGHGARSNVAIDTFYTLARNIVFNSAVVGGSTSVLPGASVSILFNLSNPDTVAISSFVINGIDCVATKISSTTYSANYISNSDGGKEDVIVEKVSYVIGEGEKQRTLYLPTDYDTAIDVCVLGSVSVKNVYVESHMMNSTNNKLYIEFIGSEPYDINKVGVNIDSECLRQAEFNTVKVSDTLYYIVPPIEPYWVDGSYCGEGPFEISITSITYGLNGNYSTVNASSVPVAYALGSTPTTEPIEISTPEQLQNMKDFAAYKLVNNIDLSGFDWQLYEFKGLLDGNGFSIKNLTIANTVTENTVVTDENGYVTSYTYIGLFTLNKGTIKNLTVENASVSLTSTYGMYLCMGILAGQNDGYIEDVTVNGNVSAIILNGERDDYECNYNLLVGGAVGYNAGVAYDSTYIGEVSSAVVNLSQSSTSALFSSNSYRYVWHTTSDWGWTYQGFKINCTEKLK